MTFQIFNRRTLIANQPTPNPLNGFITFNTNDQELITDLLNIDQQNAIGLRIYNTGTEYATLVVENPDIMWEKLGSPILADPTEFFGTSVSLSSDGTRVVIGSGGGTVDPPYARIYEYTASPVAGWNQLGGDISDGLASTVASPSVSISADGTRVAVGFVTSAATAGTTKVYEYSAPNWIQIGGDIDGEAVGGQSDWSVSLNIDGTILAIGSPLTGSSLSYTKIYQYSNPSWAQIGQNIDAEIIRDKSGWSVSLNSAGTRVAIGAPGSTAQLGSVRVYEYSSTPTPLWSKLGNNIVGGTINDRFGWSVSLDSSGTRIAIGAWGAGGKTRIYEYTTSWNQLGTDILSSTGSGYSVSLNDDGTRVAIGAPGDPAVAPNSGSVKVYDYTTEWSQAGQSILGQGFARQLGYSVSLTGDGTKMAVGEPAVITVPGDGNITIYEAVGV